MAQPPKGKGGGKTEGFWKGARGGGGGGGGGEEGFFPRPPSSVRKKSADRKDPILILFCKYAFLGNSHLLL